MQHKVHDDVLTCHMRDDTVHGAAVAQHRKAVIDRCGLPKLLNKKLVDYYLVMLPHSRGVTTHLLYGCTQHVAVVFNTHTCAG